MSRHKKAGRDEASGRDVRYWEEILWGIRQSLVP